MEFLIFLELVNYGNSEEEENVINRQSGQLNPSQQYAVNETFMFIFH